MATTTVFKSFWKLWSLFARESRIDLKEIQSQQWAAGRSWELQIPYMKKNMNILLPPLLSLYLIFLLLQHPSALELSHGIIFSFTHIFLFNVIFIFYQLKEHQYIYIPVYESTSFCCYKKIKKIKIIGHWRQGEKRMSWSMSWELVSICTRSVDSFGLLFDLVILPTGALLFIFEVGFTNI